MKPPNPLLFALYRRALCLYPHHLRTYYRDQILQTVRDAHANAGAELSVFWLTLFANSGEWPSSAGFS
jgi:hypothetical protein